MRVPQVAYCIWTTFTVVLLGSVFACGDRSPTPAPLPPPPTPPAPEAAPPRLPVAALELSGPTHAESWVEEAPWAEVHMCVYQVHLRASGDSLSTAEWESGSVSISLGPKYNPIYVEIAAEDIAALFGTSVVRHREERSTTLGFLLLFPLDSDAPWRDGTYTANWRFKYTTAGREHPKEVEYWVKCNLPPPIPPLSGRYFLETINDKLLPQPISLWTIMHADTFTFFPDSTYTTTALTEWATHSGEFYAGTSQRTSYRPYSRRRMYLPLLYPSYGAGFATHSDSVIVHVHVVGTDTTVWRFRKIGDPETDSTAGLTQKFHPSPTDARRGMTHFPAVHVTRTVPAAD
jgi:hypothetical protein